MEDDCPVFGWDPRSTLEECLMDAQPVQIVEIESKGNEKGA
jgi:hypothetical protein